jgi:hypothetical protein
MVAAVRQAQGAQAAAPHATAVQGQHIRAVEPAQGGPVTKGHGHFSRLTTGHLKPGHETRRRLVGAFLGVELHHPIGRAKAQSGQGIDDHADAVHARQVIAPRGWLIAIHLMEKVGHVWTSQNLLHLGGQSDGLRSGPRRQNTRVHHQHTVCPDRHALMAQPIQHRIAVGCIQQILQRVLSLAGAGT